MLSRENRGFKAIEIDQFGGHLASIVKTQFAFGVWACSFSLTSSI